MGNRDLREFKVGDVVTILPDRLEDWQNPGPYTVAKVHAHGFNRGVGHSQTLEMTNGKTFSAWWFDPATECLWAKAGSALSGVMDA